MLGGAADPARARPAPVRVHRAAARAGRRDARGRPPDPAPPGPLDVLPPARRRLRDRQLPPRAAADRARGRSARRAASCSRRSSRSRPEDFATAARRDRRAAPRAAATCRCAARSTGSCRSRPTASRCSARAASVRGLWLGEAIWVTHSGGAGRALAELMTHGDASVDLHEADPRALRQPRPEPAVRARARRPAVPRGLRRHPPAPADRAGARPAPHAVLRARGGARRGVLRERRLGAPAVVRGQRRAARRRRRLPAGVGVGGAALVADRRRPSTSRAASGSGCSTSRRSRRSRSAARAPRAYLQRLAANDVDRAGRDDRLHRDARPARRDHVRPHDHARRTTSASWS